MKPGLGIVSVGMVTAVGLDAPSSCAAMRARLDGFQETRFIGPGGLGVVGAPVPLPRNWIGQKRMVHLAAGAVADALSAAPGAEVGLALILCLAEGTRPGRPVTDPESFLRDLAAIVSLPARTRTLFLIAGAVYVSGAVVLEMAGGAYASTHGTDLAYGALASVEEVLEMAGIVVMLYARM